jgi:hypothetical protein
MSDMTATIAPKSDQMNADDLIAGPRTITVTRVTVNPGAEQPVDVFFEGDGGKPFRPGKSMRRVLVAVWGPDPSAYAGRSMTLFRDPKVTWGGMEVGGIRISHMSHMEGPIVLALTATQKARKPYKVLPLEVAKPAEPTPADKARDWAEGMIARLDAARVWEDVQALVGSPALAKGLEKLHTLDKGAAERLEAARQAAMDRAVADQPPPVTNDVYDMENAQ